MTRMYGASIGHGLFVSQSQRKVFLHKPLKKCLSLIPTHLLLINSHIKSRFLITTRSVCPQSESLHVLVNNNFIKRYYRGIVVS